MPGGVAAEGDTQNEVRGHGDGGGRRRGEDIGGEVGD